MPSGRVTLTRLVQLGECVVEISYTVWNDDVGQTAAPCKRCEKVGDALADSNVSQAVALLKYT